MFKNPDFYPTPKNLIRRMLSLLSENWQYKNILEPSAGSGSILDYIVNNYLARSRYSNQTTSANFFAIESDMELVATLHGKGHQVVDFDFLTHVPLYVYHTVIMNPPFSNGDKHLLKAWEVVSGGGEIVCLLNAETVKNPYSYDRKQVVKLISMYGSVEYIQDAFIGDDVDRKTRVEVALVYLQKPAMTDDMALEGERLGQFSEPTFGENKLADTNIVKTLVAQYNRSITIIQEMYAQALELDYLTKEARTTYTRNEKGETVKNVRPMEGVEKSSLTERIQKINKYFWDNIFERTKVGKAFTSKFSDELRKNQDKYGQLAFTEDNIFRVLEMFQINRQDHMMKSLLSVFEQSTYYHQDTESQKGWKTNKNYKIPDKLIMPYSIERRYYGQFEVVYSRRDYLNDLDLIMCWLSGKKVDSILSIENALKTAFAQDDFAKNNTTKVIESEFFTMRAYKKGTLHITFKDKDLLARFNQMASQGRMDLGNGK